MELLSASSKKLHGRTVQALVFVGQALVSASSDGSLAFWKEEHEVRREAAHGGQRVTGLCALGKSMVASVGFDGFLRIWRMPGLELFKELPAGLPSDVRLFAVKASKSFVVASGGDDGKTSKGCFSVWQNYGQPNVQRWAHLDNIYGLALEELKIHGSQRKAKANAKLWTGGRDGVLQLYELSDGPAVHLLRRVSVGTSVRSVYTNTQLGAVWCGTSEGALHVFSTSLCAPSQILPLHSGALYEIVCAKATQDPMQTVLLTCGKDLRLCCVTGSVAPNNRRHGQPGLGKELVVHKSEHQEDGASSPPPFLESMCLNVNGNRVKAFVGARDGSLLTANLRVMPNPRSSATSTKKRPAAALSSIAKVSKRPAARSSEVSSRKHPAVLKAVSVAKRPATKMAKRPAAFKAILDGSV